MDKVKRNERIGAMIKILSNSPNKSFTLTYFSDLFGSAKSTISEDIDIARETLEKYNLGTLKTVTGASGGVLYLPQPSPEEATQYISRLCRQLEDPGRILPGGFLYMLDMLSDPTVREGVKRFASWPTIPQLYIGGEFVGGCDIVRELDASGELADKLTAATAPAPA